MQSRTIHAVAAKCRRLGYRALVTDHFACPTLVIRGHEQEAQAILEKPSLRRRIRRFNRTGHLTYRDLRTLEDIDPYLDRFFAQHIARWREHEEPSLFVDPLNQEFYRALTRNLDAKGLLFSVVEYEGDAIAFHFGFDFDGVVTWYKPSFDVAHAQWSPGLVLVRHLLEHAIAQGRRELDFTIGDEAFKRRFTNVTRKTVRIQVFRDPGRYALERSRRGLVAAIKRASSAIGKGIVA
jgi:CelD/BcsL family acetyltransferase involved in cellulose biosynthesis